MQNLDGNKLPITSCHKKFIIYHVYPQVRLCRKLDVDVQLRLWEAPGQLGLRLPGAARPPARPQWGVCLPVYTRTPQYASQVYVSKFIIICHRNTTLPFHFHMLFVPLPTKVLILFFTSFSITTNMLFFLLLHFEPWSQNIVTDENLKFYGKRFFNPIFSEKFLKNQIL